MPIVASIHREGVILWASALRGLLYLRQIYRCCLIASFQDFFCCFEGCFQELFRHFRGKKQELFLFRVIRRLFGSWLDKYFRCRFWADFSDFRCQFWVSMPILGRFLLFSIRILGIIWIIGDRFIDPKERTNVPVPQTLFPVEWVSRPHSFLTKV